MTGAEVPFEVEVVDNGMRRSLPVPFVGYIDFTTADYIAELKTASRKSTWRTWELQLAAYSYATRKLEGRWRPLKVIELLKVRDGELHIEDAAISGHHEAWFVEVACAVYESASRGAFHPNPSFLCTFCDYRKRCTRP